VPESVMPAAVSTIAALARWDEQGDGERFTELRQVYAQVTDPRDARGRRHSLVSVLMLVQAAVVAGATTWAVVRHWIAAAPEHVLACCEVRVDRRIRSRCRRRPHGREVVLASLAPAGLFNDKERHLIIAVPAPVPPHWTRAGELNGVPLWRWKNEPFHAATGDMDQLLFIGAALACFDHMSGEEFQRYVTRWSPDRPGRG
jgi:hypothetical protein